MMPTQTSNQETKFGLFTSTELGYVFQTCAGALILADYSKKEDMHQVKCSLSFDIQQNTTMVNILQEITVLTLSGQSKNDWISYIREEFYSFPQVDAIYVTIDDRDVDIWLLIPHRDINLVRQLIEKEMKIFERFSDAEEPIFLIEFHVVYGNNSDENQLVPQKAIKLPK